MPYSALSELDKASANGIAGVLAVEALQQSDDPYLAGEVLIVMGGITTAVPASGSLRELIGQPAVLAPLDKELVGVAEVPLPSA